MNRKAVLGKVAPESYKDFVDAVDESMKEMEQIGGQELSELKPDNTPEWNAYKLMNGLGNIYGAALVRAYVKDILPDTELPNAVDASIDHLWMIYNDLEARRSLRDNTVIRQASEEMPEYVPAWLNLDQIIAAAHASYQGKGVYFNDFYYSVMQIVGDIARAFRMFLLQDKRPETVVFRKQRGGGEYLPKALLDLTEEEERNLLKSIIREANKRIAKQGYYGLRQEPLPASGDFSFLYWANGPAAWRMDNRARSAMIARDNGLTSLRLDANVVLIPFHEALVEKVIDVLDDLPLYTYSSEAKARGEYPEPTDKNVREALRSIIREGNPTLDREELALMEVKLFELLVLAKRGTAAAIARVVSLLESQPRNLFPFVRLIEQWLER